MRPRVFVGCSVEALPIAHAIQKNLVHQAEVTVWDQGIFHLSQSSLQSLVAVLETFDFGVFVFSPDDLLVIRGSEHQVVRDNVLFELGLFIGELGQSRCFILIPDGETNLRLPTDLLGVEPGSYDPARSDDNLQAATGPACTDIRHELKLQGRRSVADERGEGTAPAPEAGDAPPKKPETKQPEEAAPVREEIPWDPWLVSMVEGRPAEALSQVEAAILKEEAPEKLLDLRLWRVFILFDQSIAQGEAEYRSVAAENPQSPQPWAQWSSALLNRGFRERALAVADDGLAALPNATSILIAKAQALDSLQRFDEAVLLLEEKTHRLAGDDEALFAQLCRSLAQHGKSAEALEAVNRGLLRFPFSIELLEAKAGLLSSSQHAASISVYRQLISLKPKEPSYHALMANALLALDLYGLALDAYRHADSLADSRQAWIAANIGNILNNRGFFGFAIEYLERAIASDPSSDYAHERVLSARRNRAAEWQRLETAINDSIARNQKPTSEGS